MTVTNQSFAEDSSHCEPPLMLPLEQQMLQLTLGNSVTQAIYAAAQLGIADLLAQGSKDCDELARLTHTHSAPLYRILRFLSKFEIFKETLPKHFELTPLAETLLDKPGSLRKYVLFRGDEAYRALADIMHPLYTGECAFKKTYGSNRPDYLKQHPDRAKLFSEGMSAGSDLFDSTLLSVFDFSSIKTLVNIDGLDRTYVLSILKHYSEMKAVFFEEPHRLETTRQTLTEAGVITRCELIEGSFFDWDVIEADAYLFSAIHRLNHHDAALRLQKCGQKMAQGGRLFIIEKVVSPQIPWLFLENDLTMLMSTDGGGLRTLNEFIAVLNDGGFSLTQFVAINAAMGLLEAKVSL
jgi:O-methyltransferase domain/Dimerisation domain